MATKTGSITTKLSKYGLRSTYVVEADLEAFFAGSGKIGYNTNAKYGQTFLYGMDFRELADKDNVKITGFTITVTGTTPKSSKVTNAVVKWNMVRDFPTSGVIDTYFSNPTFDTITYNDLGDGRVGYSGSIAANATATVVKTHNDMPNTFAWMNANIDKVIAGYDSGTFGILMYVGYAKMTSFTMSVDYEYTDSVNKIYIGTQQSKAIYVGTTPAKAIYVGTTKVYG